MIVAAVIWLLRLAILLIVIPAMLVGFAAAFLLTVFVDAVAWLARLRGP